MRKFPTNHRHTKIGQPVLLITKSNSKYCTYYWHRIATFIRLRNWGDSSAHFHFAPTTQRAIMFSKNTFFNFKQIIFWSINLLIDTFRNTTSHWAQQQTNSVKKTINLHWNLSISTIWKLACISLYHKRELSLKAQIIISGMTGQLLCKINHKSSAQRARKLIKMLQHSELMTCMWHGTPQNLVSKKGQQFAGIWCCPMGSVPIARRN